MKKIVTKSVLAIIISASALTSNAQDLAGGIFINAKTTRVVDPETKQASRILATNEVNMNAARDFNKKYSNAQDITWVEGKNGSSVYFVHKGAKMRATYDRKGRNEYTLKYYAESAMPASLRHLIKSNYYDHKIDIVTEVERNRTTYYLVRMQNDNEFLTVKVVDGEITPYEKLNKAN